MKIRPFIKWAGGKYNCLDILLTHLPKGKRLIEPFGGSGVVSLNASYPSYLIAESNQDLISIFNFLKEEGTSFIDFCKTYFEPENNYKETYYQFRDEFNSLPFNYKRAALFLYLNRHGYNGLCRYNSKGIYNVPFGLYKKAYFPFEEMNSFYEHSKKTSFVHQDFRETFSQAQIGDVIYCDPPYVPLKESTPLISYNSKKFDNEEHIELAKLAQHTAAKGIPVLISNHDTEFTRSIYSDATIKSFRVSRFINCIGDNRNPVKEIVAIFQK